MNKTVFVLALVSLLSVGLVASSSYAKGMAGGSGFMMMNSRDLIGAPVKDSHGGLVGVVSEVMVDNGGHALAMINHGDYDLAGPGGINTPVPFREFRIIRAKAGQDTVVLKTDMEHLDYAPYFDPSRKDSRQYEATVYEYYGIEPYWTRSGAAEKGRFMELNSLNLAGAAVENSSGKVIGIVKEVMVDSRGHAFAVINHGDSDLYGESGKNTPVPVEELSIFRSQSGQDIALLKTDTEHLDLAPNISPLTKTDRQYEADIYEFYGIAPYWTRSGK